MKKSINLYFNNTLDTKVKIDAIKESGFDEFFICADDRYENIPWIEQIKYAKKIGLNCTMVHCSYKGLKVDNFWLDNELGENLFNKYKSEIKQIGNLSKNYVIHLDESDNSIVSEIGVKRIKELLKICKTNDINLCVENIHSSKEIPYLFSNINDKNLKICFDLGHRNVFTPEFDIMKEYGDYVEVLHIHDNHGEKDEHLIIGQGNIDLKSFAKQMKNKNNLVLTAEIKKNEDKDFRSTLKETKKALDELEQLIVINNTL